MDSKIGLLFISAIYLVAAIIWLLPVILISGSSRAYGKEKMGWLVAGLLLSWLAWLLHLLLAPLADPATRKNNP